MDNPFFKPYNTPHDTVPFDKIKFEHYEEAFVEGIRRDNELIERITSNPEKPTFDNTIIDREDDSEGYYDLLERVSTVFFNRLSADTNDELDALAQKIQPMLTQHANDVRLNPKLFERIKYVHRHHRKLTAEEKKLLDDTYEGLVRGGALLSEEDKDKLRQLTEEASMLGLQFSQNLLKETKAYTLYINNEDDLDGLPQSAIDAAALAAKEQGKDGGWLFTLDQPSYTPFMTYSTRRDLRKQMYMARNTICTHDNTENNLAICQRLVNLRREIAQLLGYKTYADYVLKRRMAKNKRGVYKLLNELTEAYKPVAIKERESLTLTLPKGEGTLKDSPTARTKAKSNKKSSLPFGEGWGEASGADGLKPWDIPFYSHKLKMKKYNLDAEMLRPYFQLDKVIDGVFGLANRLYGITFRENKDIPVYHPDVKAYEVFDEDGSYLAVFYADFHPRKGKQGGAWMTEYQGQSIDKKGENIRPHVSVVMNLTPPSPLNPPEGGLLAEAKDSSEGKVPLQGDLEGCRSVALLTLSEVETFLHEFGHALHGMFANTRFESMSGTNVLWDFVELPSQFMENYAVEKDFLNTFARHYETGEPIPDELIKRIRKSRNFNVATACLRQLSLGLLDMAYYTLDKEFTEDIIQFEKKAWAKATIGKQLPDTCMTVQFSHIMAGGYAAGYYSYKWAEVLEADAFSVFKKNGIFDRKTAKRFREEILSKGGTEHPMELYKRFRGSEPTIKALLKRNGII